MLFLIIWHTQLGVLVAWAWNLVKAPETSVRPATPQNSLQIILHSQRASTINQLVVTNLIGSRMATGYILDCPLVHVPCHVPSLNQPIKMPVPSTGSRCLNLSEGTPECPLARQVAAVDQKPPNKRRQAKGNNMK